MTCSLVTIVFPVRGFISEIFSIGCIVPISLFANIILINIVDGFIEFSSSCKSIKPYIINYITTSQYVFYSLEYDYSLDDKYYEEVLNSLYEFPSIAFPRVYFTSKGECFFVKNGFNNEEHSNRNIKKLFDYYIN